MKKIVINRRYGGFGLSDAGYQHYAKLRGLTLYPEKDKYGLTSYWTVPEDQRPQSLEGMAWHMASQDDRIAHNQAYKAAVLYDNDLARDDPFLVQTVEELGKDANGDHAELKIVEIPDDVDWEIDDYDGMESVAEKHRTWC